MKTSEEFNSDLAAIMAKKVSKPVHYDLEFTLTAEKETFDGVTGIKFYYSDTPGVSDDFLLSYTG